MPFLSTAWTAVSASARTLTMALLHRTPAMRLTAKQILEDRWLEDSLSTPPPLAAAAGGSAPRSRAIVLPPPPAVAEPSHPVSPIAKRAGAGTESPGHAAASVLLAAAADELESMRERLRKSRAAETAASERGAEAMRELARAQQALAEAQQQTSQAQQQATEAQAAAAGLAAADVAQLHVRLDAEIAAHLVTRAVLDAVWSDTDATLEQARGTGAATSMGAALQRASSAGTGSSAGALTASAAVDVAAIQRACLAWLVAEMTSDDDAIPPMRERLELSLEQGEVDELMAPMLHEIASRDERIAELEHVEAQLRLELQTKRQRIAASERTSEELKQSTEVLEAEASELRAKWQQGSLRCGALEVSLQRAEAEVQRLQHAFAALQEDRNLLLERPPGEAPGDSTTVEALDAELATLRLRREVEAALIGEREREHEQLRARHNAEISILSSELSSGELEPSRGELEATHHATTPPDTMPAALLKLRSELDAEWRGRIEKEVANALAKVEAEAQASVIKAAEAARVATEDKWRQHLARAVLLTRQEAAREHQAHLHPHLPPKPEPDVPQMYKAATNGQETMLSDLQLAIAAANRQKQQQQELLQRRRAGSSSNYSQHVSVADRSTAASRSASTVSVIERTTAASRSQAAYTAADRSASGFVSPAQMLKSTKFM